MEYGRRLQKVRGGKKKRGTRRVTDTARKIIADGEKRGEEGRRASAVASE